MTLEQAKNRKCKLQLEKKQIAEFRCLSTDLKEKCLEWYENELRVVNNNIAFHRVVGVRDEE